jgi:hypothetical protein
MSILKRYMLAGLAGVLISTAWAVNSMIPREEFMDAAEAQRRWGSRAFESKAFKEGDMATRSQMAASILKTQPFVGQDVNVLRESLGTQDGFYRMDMFPAYLIQTAQSRKDESWQILFRLGSEYRIKDVKIHKNCCYE